MLFWTEWLLLGMCVLWGLGALKRSANRLDKTQRALGISSLLLLVACANPQLDALARFSLWLHSWQSVMLHLLLPLMWAAALVGQACSGAAYSSNFAAVSLGQFSPVNASIAPSGHRLPPHWLWPLAVVSIIAVLVWMLPDFHQIGMASSGWYSVGKWLMVVSGWLMSEILLLTLTKPVQASISRVLMTALMIVPMALWGSLMLLFDDFYAHSMVDSHGSAGESLMSASSAHHTMLMPVAIDQWLAAWVVLSGCVAYGFGERLLKQRNPFTVH